MDLDKLAKWVNNHKTQLMGAVAIVTGIITMLTAYDSETGKFDSNQVNVGWTQILGGFTAIFLRQGTKKVEEKVDENTKITNETSQKLDENTELTRDAAHKADLAKRHIQEAKKEIKEQQ